MRADRMMPLETLLVAITLVKQLNYNGFKNSAGLGLEPLVSLASPLQATVQKADLKHSLELWCGIAASRMIAGCILPFPTTLYRQADSERDRP